MNFLSKEYIISLLLFVSLNLSAQINDWTYFSNHFQSANGLDERITISLLDDIGNLHVVGKINLSYGYGMNDILYQKYNVNGDLLLSKLIGGDLEERPLSLFKSLDHDTTGNIVISGLTYSFSQLGNQKTFFIEIDSSGNLVRDVIYNQYFTTPKQNNVISNFGLYNVTQKNYRYFLNSDFTPYDSTLYYVSNSGGTSLCAETNITLVGSHPFWGAAFYFIDDMQGLVMLEGSQTSPNGFYSNAWTKIDWLCSNCCSQRISLWKNDDTVPNNSQTILVAGTTETFGEGSKDIFIARFDSGLFSLSEFKTFGTSLNDGDIQDIDTYFSNGKWWLLLKVREYINIGQNTRFLLFNDSLNLVASEEINAPVSYGSLMGFDENSVWLIDSLNAYSVDDGYIRKINFNSIDNCEQPFTPIENSYNIIPNYTGSMISSPNSYNWGETPFVPNLTFNNFSIMDGGSELYVDSSCMALGNTLPYTTEFILKLFPNPSNDVTTLTLADHCNGKIILTDILGKEVLSKSFSSSKVQINLKRLTSKGTYFAKVLDIDGNVIAIKKLIYQ